MQESQLREKRKGSVMMAGNIKSVAPRFIRTETMAFQDAVIRQLDRLNELGIDVGMNMSRDSLMAYEIAIRDLHFMFYPTYSSEVYERDFALLTKKLKKEYMYGAKPFRFLYIKDLQEWKGLLVKEFAQIDILPPTRKDLEMGDDEGDDDDGDEHKDAK